MERARRAAESPLRAILEAGKVAAPVPATAAGAPAAPVVLPLVAPPTPVITLRTLPGAPEAPLPPAPPASSAASESAPTLLPVRPPAAVLVQPIAPVSPMPPGPLAEPVPRPPQILHMVEPEAPPRLLDQLGRAEVTVEFTIRPDGSVADVQVQPPVPRALVPRIIEAVEQWRYAPLPAPRKQRVQLVFKGAG